MAQAAHRATGVLGIGSLALHVIAKIEYGRAAPAAVVPFADPHQRFLAGLGALALWLMVAAAVTGAARSAFVARRHPGRWRLLHGVAYLGWCSSLVHGLKAGQPESSPWVTAGYGACLLAVVVVPVWRAVRRAGAGTDDRFGVDWTLCDGHGLCAGMVPELIRIGPDGYPFVSTSPIPPYLAARAQAAARRCPTLALRVEGIRSGR
ncbi:ferredoxin [Streptomyces sp. TRM68416]|nr:ferredoxin [Streptomyces sp. TRM68416]